MKKVAFRVDASTIIGSGHIMRCLTLADALRTQGAGIHFICRGLPAIFESLITQREFALHRLPLMAAKPNVDNDQESVHAHWLGASWKEDAQASIDILESLGGVDLLVTDHYAIEARWERCVRVQVKAILVIDDLADREHDCNFLLDQNLFTNQNVRYKPYLDEKTQCFLGPRYAILRPEFAQAQQAFPRGERPLAPVKRVNICFGGMDATGETIKALEALKPWLDEEGLSVNVILAAASPHRKVVETKAKQNAAITLHVSPNNMAELLTTADLGIGASGSMTWERACVGLPSIVMAVAQNQQRPGEDAGRAGIHLFLGESRSVSIEHLRLAFAFLRSNPLLRQGLAENCLRLMDGRGAQRVARRVMVPEISLRQALMEDCKNVFVWRNDLVNRRNAHDPREISYEEHQCWFEKTLIAKDRFLLIGSDENGPVGVLRYDYHDDYWMTSVYLVPDRHGEGLGTPLLMEGLEWLKAHCKGRISVKAEIRSENGVSEVVFERAGFIKRFSTLLTEVSAP